MGGSGLLAAGQRYFLFAASQACISAISFSGAAMIASAIALGCRIFAYCSATLAISGESADEVL